MYSQCNATPNSAPQPAAKPGNDYATFKIYTDTSDAC